MKTKEEILQWLRQHDWYHSFEINTIRFWGTTFDEYLSRAFNNNQTDLLITSAFYWGSTEEGYPYWGKINAEYKKWLETDNANKTMKQTIEIEVPEGKKAVWKDGKVIFEDIKPKLPKSWEEFCKKYPVKNEECFIVSNSEIGNIIPPNRNISSDRNILPTKEAAEAHLALMQLHQLRDCYRQGWVPDWNNAKQTKYCIKNYSNMYYNISYTTYVHFLAFQTEEIAKEFFHNFEDLIKKAGDLI